MRRSQGSKSIVDVSFPVGGVVRRLAIQRQSPYTTFSSMNVFPDDSFVERERGGSRPPMVSAPGFGAGAPCNHIGELGFVDNSENVKRYLITCGGGTFTSYDKNGTVHTFGGVSGDYSLTGSEMLGKYYLAHGNTADKEILEYDPLAGTLAAITPSEGTVPTKCKIVIRWRDRLVCAEDLELPHEIYMSRQGNVEDWDFTRSDAQSAVEFSATPAGRLGQPVRALIPHTNNCLLIATQSEWYVLRGDPTRGGSVFLINNQLGIVGRQAWCHAPDGYTFMLTQDGLYMMPPGCGDQLISVSREKLPKELLNLPRDEFCYSMAYDRRLRGILIFCTRISDGGVVVPGQIDPPIGPPTTQGSDPPFGAQLGTTHFFVDIRNTAGNDMTNARACSFWPMSVNFELEPTFTYGSREVDDEPAALLGARGGGLNHFYRRGGSFADSLAEVIVEPGTNLGSVNPSEEEPFPTHLLYGPFALAPVGNVGVVEQIRATISPDSGPVSFKLFVSDDAESLITLVGVDEEPHFKGVWNKENETPALQYVEYPKLRGRYLYILVEGGNGEEGSDEGEAWAIESLEFIRSERGRTRRHRIPVTNKNNSIQPVE